MQRKADYENSELKEQMDLDKLIVMDNVSGHADKSDVFSNFLTVSRKYGMSCVYIFHTVYPNRQNWDMIMPQIYIFNFFPGSVHNGPILRKVSLFANNFKNSYVPTHNMWFSRLYFNISNSKQKQCLTIDTRDINDLGPGKFRTSADNETRQICYYNRIKSNTSFNSFLATREQTSQKGTTKFSTDKVISNINNADVNYLELGDKLKRINNDNNIEFKLERASGNSFIRGGSKSENRGQNKPRDYRYKHGRVSKKPGFQDNNAIKVKYTTTRIKSRNFLFNIAYVGVNKEDYYNNNFVFDVYLLLTKNLNLFSLHRKLADKTKHETIYMPWRECMPLDFYNFIFEEKYVVYLNGKNILQPKVRQIIGEFIEKYEKNYRLLQNNLSCYKNFLQYVYSNVYPEIYCST